jgi:DNA polymerase-3 subunit epsilon
MDDRLKNIAEELEQSGDYKILRRLRQREEFSPSPTTGERLFIGLALDVEATGLDIEDAEIIEFAAIKFTYTRSGKIIRIIDTFSAFQQPQAPIPDEMKILTGITDKMVAGHAINASDIASFVKDAAILIAHNASYDRQMVEKTWPQLAQLAWACSYAEIPWRAHGFESAKLGNLLAGHGLFHEGHRALDDCHALLHLLSAPLGEDGAPALAALLASARQPSVRVWAINAPFEFKERLKIRNYRWSDGTDGRPRAWWIDLKGSDLPAELNFLKSEVYRGRDVDLPTARMTARERYSRRILPKHRESS